jgi:hypothetical protein
MISPSPLGLATLAPVHSHAKDSGLSFVSNEKSNNPIVIDPQTHRIVRNR